MTQASLSALSTGIVGGGWGEVRWGEWCLRCAILGLAPRLRWCHVLIIAIARLSLLGTEGLGAAIVAVGGGCARVLVLGLRGRRLRCSVRIKLVEGVEGLELLKGVLGYLSAWSLSVARGDTNR